MSQTMSALSRSAVSADQHAVGFAVSEDRGFKRLRREYSPFSLRNVLGLIGGLKRSSDEFRIIFMFAALPLPLSEILVTTLPLGDVILPPPMELIVAGIAPALVLSIVGMILNADKTLLAKHKTVMAIRRSAKRVDSTARPVLTANHFYYKAKLDKLLLSGAKGMSKKERTANADSMFALMLEDFEKVEEVFELMESRGLFSAVEVRTVVAEARGVVRPFRDGAL